jgi:SAM-dependent methyltransferase
MSGDAPGTGKAWDAYWRDAESARGLYAGIAWFYRRFLIAPMLRDYVVKQFRDEEGRQYLHAGCGSAQSDSLIPFKKATFVFLDLSAEALVLAKQQTRANPVEYVQGDLFRLPFPDRSFDGFWNLGVMEHFTEEELRCVFRELRRVMKDDAVGLVFWPPRYGLSVLALGAAHFVMNKILRLGVSLHASEPTKYRSRKWADRLLRTEGLIIKDSRFGFRDALTYVRLCVVRSGGVQAGSDEARSRGVNE